jgi:hypothetical protein
MKLYIIFLTCALVVACNSKKDETFTKEKNKNENCLDIKISDYRKEAGSDAIIKIDIIEEWEKECADLTAKSIGKPSSELPNQINIAISNESSDAISIKGKVIDKGHYAELQLKLPLQINKGNSDFCSNERVDALLLPSNLNYRAVVNSEIQISVVLSCTRQLGLIINTIDLTKFDGSKITQLTTPASTTQSSEDKRFHPNNTLERAANPGVSSVSDFDEWRNSGGLAVSSKWLGYRVTDVYTHYTNNVIDILKLEIIINGDKIGSFNNLKKDLGRWCDAEWVSLSSQKGSYISKGSKYTCDYMPSDYSSLISIVKK